MIFAPLKYVLLIFTLDTKKSILQQADLPGH